jgi:copper chaperone CopZ
MRTANTSPIIRTASFAAISLLTLASGCASSGGHSSSTHHASPDGTPVAQGAGSEEGIIHVATVEQTAATHSRKPITASTAVLYVNGLGCPLCATNIDKQLMRVDGVSAAQVNLGNGTVAIAITGAKRPTPHDISESVLDAGFTLVRIEYQ